MRMFTIASVFVASAMLCAQTTPFQRGDLVRLTPADSGSHVVTSQVLQVVAIAGDRMHLDEGTLYVNDTPVIDIRHRP